MVFIRQRARVGGYLTCNIISIFQYNHCIDEYLSHWHLMTKDNGDAPYVTINSIPLTQSSHRFPQVPLSSWQCS